MMENEPNESINGVDENGVRMDYMQKLVLAGSAFRLPEDPKKVTPQSWNGWLSGIRATIQDEDIVRVEKLKYLWDPEPDVEHPLQGVPKNITELSYLLKIGRISRFDIEYTSTGNDNGHPSVTAWNDIQALTDFVVVKSGDGPSATAENLRKITDKIVEFITTKMYENVPGPPGTLAAKYFGEYADNRKAIRKFRAFAEKLLPNDINEGFQDGFYVDYDAMIGAMKRKYGMGNEQKTMVDQFLKLDKILEKETKTEFLMGSLRSMVKKLLVVKTEDMPYIQYYKGHKERITHKEEFGPMINFLLEYIMFNKKLPRTKWKQVEKDYHHLLDGQPSYKKWHESSYELWHIIDRELNLLPNIQAQVDEKDEELNAVRKFRQSNRKPQTQYPTPKLNMGRSTQYKQRSNNNNSSNNNKARNDRIKNRLAKYKCRHCTKVAGTPKYHRPPYGGGGESQCPYDSNGKSRPGYFFMAVIEGLRIDELNLTDDEDDDILFENEVTESQNRLTDLANQSATDKYQFAD